MKTKILLALIVSSFLIRHSSFAQGALTPPGAPAPTMKTLTQIEPRTPISSLPYTITNPGSYYVTTNLTGTGTSSGITISTNNVTVDLCGFTLQGVPGSGNGIFVYYGPGSTSLTNLVVRNGTLTGWSGDGLDAWDSGYPRNMRFEHLMASYNTLRGIYTEADSVVSDCQALNNGQDGIYSQGGQVTGCIARANGNYGIETYGDRVRGCQVQFNTNGIYADHSVVEDCDISENPQNGIVVQSECQIINNRFADNSNNGLGNGDAILIQGACNYVAGNSIMNNFLALYVTGAGATNNFIIQNRFLLSSSTFVANANNVFPFIEFGSSTPGFPNFPNTNSFINIIYP